MLKISNLVKTYPGKPAPVLDLPNLELAPQDSLALIGPSGSGKSTLLNIIAGIIRPCSGAVHLLGTDILGLSEAKMDAFRSRHIGYVFQNFNLLSGFSALENVMMAMQFAKVIPAKERSNRAKDLLALVGLEQHFHQNVERLSQGEQQRVAIARSLANKPSLILADEPTANLDADNAEAVFSLLVDVCRQTQAALLLCTHDEQLAGRLDRRLDLGKSPQTNRLEVNRHVSPSYRLAQYHQT